MVAKLSNSRSRFLIPALVFLAAGLFSCRPARHIPESNHLLDRYRIDAPANDIDRDELRRYVRQRPNKRILGLRFHLWLYNMANPQKDGWPHNWLRRIGEEPVIYDSFITERSSNQLQQYLRNKGYYNAQVDDTVRFRRKRAVVTYRIEPREPYHIAGMDYLFEDEGLRELILADTVNSLIGKGVVFDVDILQEERIRIEEYLRNQGYYYFTREHVFFNADTTAGNRGVDLTLGISRFRERGEDGTISLVPHRRYRIGDVYILPSYNPRDAIDRPDEYYHHFDTLLFRDMHYLYSDEMPVSARVLAQSTHVLPGDLYMKENEDRTYRHLFALRLFRLVNIRFIESGMGIPLDDTVLPVPGEPEGGTPQDEDALDSTGGDNRNGEDVMPAAGGVNRTGNSTAFDTAAIHMNGRSDPDISLHMDGLNGETGSATRNPDQPEDNLPRLDAWIQLTPFNLQSYTIELEGTNSSGDFGFGGNIAYQHRNFFGGAEIFDFRIKGSIETLGETHGRSFRNTYEYGAEAGLQIPRFMLPIRSVSFVRRYNPRTNITMAYNYQLRPDYTRTIANTGFGYTWRGSEFTTHIINPVEVNLVRLPYATPEFLEIIRRYNLEASFRDHMVSETNYSFIFNNQDIRRPSDFVFFRYNAEIAGNILAAYSSIADRPREDGYYRVFGTGFAQYFKTDADLRFYNVLADENTLVYRFFAGAGLPYGNSTALPFEKKYFSGGANSIRAWQVRSLGPGSFHEPADRSFPNRTADIKLEANIEYRFGLFWLLEGALFLDAGNIWAIDDNDGREGAVFSFDRFYNEIAVGTGMGLRFDFSFFIFRLDMGVKLRDPARPDGRRWIPVNRTLNFKDDIAFNIGIGYPF